MKKTVGFFLLLLTLGSIDLRAADDASNNLFEQRKALKAALDMSNNDIVAKEKAIRKVIGAASDQLALLGKDEKDKEEVFGVMLRIGIREIQTDSFPLDAYSYSALKGDQNKTLALLCKAVGKVGTVDACRKILVSIIKHNHVELMKAFLLVMQERLAEKKELLQDKHNFFRDYFVDSPARKPLDYARSEYSSFGAVGKQLVTILEEEMKKLKIFSDTDIDTGPPFDAIQKAFTLKNGKSIDRNNFKKAVDEITEKCKLR